MKVGDLVRHRELAYWTGIVVGVEYPPRTIANRIKVHDKDGSECWQRMNEYEVISESW